MFVEARRAGTLETINALAYDACAWRLLQETYRVGELLMPCCGGAAVPKVSPNGYHFFAHAAGACSTSEETQWHKQAKSLVRATLEMLGCKAREEEPGAGVAGEWVSDVWAERGGTKLAVEIQRSYQHVRDYKDRQSRYRTAGVHSVWLLRGDRMRTVMRSLGKERLREEFGGKLPPSGLQPGSPDLPIFELVLEPAPKVLGPMFFSENPEDFLRAALDARLKCIDNVWCVDSLERQRAKLEDVRAENALNRASKALLRGGRTRPSR